MLLTIARLRRYPLTRFFVLLTLLHIADMWSTAVALSQPGGHELSPIPAWMFAHWGLAGGFIASTVCMVYCFASCLLVAEAGPRGMRAVRVLLALGSIGLAVVVAGNILTIMHTASLL